MTEELAAEACYRHEKRETYIHCQRCERPICIDCQTPGAVGVLCPSCVHPGGTSRDNRRRTRARRGELPTVTVTLIAISAVIFVLQWIPGLDVTGWLLFAPVYSLGEYSVAVPYEPWRMVTSIFVHSTSFLLHILLNMYTLWVFGQVLESMLGRARFLLLFLISGLGGSVAVMYLAAPQTGVVGASGAIFGLLGAFLVIQRRLGGDSTQLLVLVGINLVIGFLPGMSISWQAHVGGLVTGLVLGLIFMSTRRPQQQQRQWLLIGLTAFALILLIVSRSPMVIG